MPRPQPVPEIAAPVEICFQVRLDAIGSHLPPAPLVQPESGCCIDSCAPMNNMAPCRNPFKKGTGMNKGPSEPASQKATLTPWVVLLLYRQFRILVQQESLVEDNEVAVVGSIYFPPFDVNGFTE